MATVNGGEHVRETLAASQSASQTPTVYNFSAGPSLLPAPVMARVQQELLDYRGTGLSIIETSHRSETFSDIVDHTEARLRELLGIPQDYAVLLLQGGASLQFVMPALNLTRPGDELAYVDTGHWSKDAIAIARELRPVNVVASAEDNQYTDVPRQDDWEPLGDCVYLHYATNETTDGLEFDFVPDAGGRPLIADMSSNVLSQPIDVSDYDLIYAGAQKNLGAAGLTLVIIKRELAERAGVEVPTILRYRSQIEAGSVYNTPPTFTWYTIGLYLDWVAEQGGANEMARRADARSRLVYEAIDNSDGFYINKVTKRSRSRINIPFNIDDPELEERFVQEAQAAGLKQLKGHRSRGGMRVSLYNAMPIAGAEALADFMQDFARRNG